MPISSSPRRSRRSVAVVGIFCAEAEAPAEREHIVQRPRRALGAGLFAQRRQEHQTGLSAAGDLDRSVNCGAQIHEGKALDHAQPDDARHRQNRRENGLALTFQAADGHAGAERRQHERQREGIGHVREAGQVDDVRGDDLQLAAEDLKHEHHEHRCFMFGPSITASKSAWVKK